VKPHWGGPLDRIVSKMTACPTRPASVHGGGALARCHWQPTMEGKQKQHCVAGMVCGFRMGARGQRTDSSMPSLTVVKTQSWAKKMTRRIGSPHPAPKDRTDNSAGLTRVGRKRVTSKKWQLSTPATLDGRRGQHIQH